MRHAVSLAVVLCLAAGTVSAATFERVTDAALVERSQNVVVGDVLDAKARQRDNGSIVTEYRLAVEQVLKGHVDTDTITISEFGGMANGLIFIIPGSATYTPGSRVVAFLNARADGTYFTSHMALGKFAFESRRDVEMLTRDENGVELQNGSRTLDARDPAKFFNYVRDAARGAEVEEYAPSIDVPAADRRTPRTEAAGDYALTGGPAGGPFLPVRWQNCETNCVIGYFWNGDQPGVVNDAGSIDNAMAAWNNHPTSFVNLGLGGNSTVTDLTVPDNESTILLNNTSSPDFGQCNGAIACGGVWATSSTHTYRGVTFYTAFAGDLVVRPGTYNTTQFESIVAHELGHTIGLRHSNAGTPSSNAALMRSVVPLSGPVLQGWDNDAMAEMYGPGIPCTSPSITSTNGAGNIFSGQTRTLSVTAGGTAPFTYQWYRGNTLDTSNPVGTNSSSFTTPPLTETTSYWVRVSGCTPAVNANSSTITVVVDECPAVTITTQPQNKNIASNTSTTLTVAAQGGSPFTYQWYRGSTGNTSNPVGSNSPSFTTPQLTVATSYWVRVTNTCGLTALSDTATVGVEECPKPAFTTQPASHENVAPNTTVTLTVATSSATTVTYQWFRGTVGDTSNPVGTNSTSFTTPPVTGSNTYWVRATNNCGSTNSAAALVAPGAACATLGIALIPSTVNVLIGETVGINVTPSGTGPFTYQWYRGDSPDTTTPAPDGTSSSLALGPFTVTGTSHYWVKITDSCSFTLNSPTVVVNVVCASASAPKINSPAMTHFSSGYNVKWTGNLVQTPSFELQEARDAAFTTGLKTFLVTGELSHHIDAHLEITTDTRFYYRVRGTSSCTGQPTPYSTTTTTIVTAAQPSNSSEFSISVPQDAAQPFTQPYLVPGFGETATASDAFAIVTDAPWLTVFPQSGALSAGGTTVQFTINPALVGIGSSTGTIVVTRTQGSGKGGPVTNAGGGITLPFTVSKVTPVTPAPRDANAPPGTLIVPAIAHADGIGTRFQSDVRIVNASGEPISYELSFTPSQTNGTETGKQLPLTIEGNETKGLDDLVKAWFGAGLLGEGGLGTLEIRPLNGANPASTFASSRTYAIDSKSVSDNANCQIVRCTLGQFIPALGLDKFVSNIANDSLGRISLQQISNSTDATGFRTNLGFVEGSGTSATMLLTLRDGANNILNQVTKTLPPYGHEQTSLAAVFGNIAVNNARVEVEVTSPGGKVSSYASVVDNATSDPLLVFPVQAAKVSAQHYVVPGVAELNNGPSSNFHTDMRVYNASSTPATIALSYFPGFGGTRPADINVTLAAGEVKAIDNVLPELWHLTATGGAVAVDAPGNASLVVTARTFSRNADGGTFGQFIPGVTAADGVGAGDRALELLQLEQSDQYRTNLGLVEVTGNPVTVEIVGQTGNKLTARTEATLSPNEFRQIGLIFQQLGFNGASYTGRVSVKVIGGNGRVAAYGSVVDNKTVDPTYVPAQ
jgi:hypothetical protein